MEHTGATPQPQELVERQVSPLEVTSEALSNVEVSKREFQGHLEHFRSMIGQAQEARQNSDNPHIKQELFSLSGFIDFTNKDALARSDGRIREPSRDWHLWPDSGVAMVQSAAALAHAEASIDRYSKDTGRELSGPEKAIITYLLALFLEERNVAVVAPETVVDERLRNLRGLLSVTLGSVNLGLAERLSGNDGQMAGVIQREERGILDLLAVAKSDPLIKEAVVKVGGNHVQPVIDGNIAGLNMDTEKNRALINRIKERNESYPDESLANRFILEEVFSPPVQREKPN